jgi:tetratricopeptide (TPR) repeat protein
MKQSFSLIVFSLAVCWSFIQPCEAKEDHVQHFLNGLSYSERGDYQKAIDSYQKAIDINPTEKRNVRFYGMRYGDYFPHRQKGIAHYHLRQYGKALEELEISLNQLSSDEARKFLELAKIGEQSLRQTPGGPENTAESIPIPEELKKLRRAVAENRHAVAVVIGNRDYRSKDVPPVNFAIEDARRIKDALITTFGYREGNIIFEANATKGTLESIFGTDAVPRGKLADYIESGKSDLFVYYSGHGAPSLDTRKGYILPVDSDPNNVAIGGYPLDVLYRNLASLPFRSLTVVTDACFSGANVFKNASPVGIIVENPLVAMRNTSIFNSSLGTELSSWYPEKGHGLFTYYFLLAMTGKGDQNGDGKLTVGELSDYLKDNVPYMARQLFQGRMQTPTSSENDRNKVLVGFR